MSSTENSTVENSKDNNDSQNKVKPTNSPQTAANTQGNQPQTQPEQPPAEQPRGRFSMWKMIIIWFLVSNGIKLIQSYFTNTDTLRTESKRFHNLFEDGQEYSLYAYVTKRSSPNLTNVEPIWTETGLFYNYEKSNHREVNLTIENIQKVVAQNSSLWLHILVKSNRTDIDLVAAKNVNLSLSGAFDRSKNKEVSLHERMPLIRYLPQDKKAKELSNLLTKKEEKNETRIEIPADAYIPYFKPTIYISMVHDSYSYVKGEFDPRFAKDLKINEHEMYYEPVLYISDFWLINDYLMPLNETVSSVNLNIIFDTLWLQKFLLQKQFSQTQTIQQDMGMMTEGGLDELKRVIMETNIILLAITSIVTVTHSLFEFLAFKNDIAFWKNANSMKGISVKSVFIETAFNLIIFLYLWDNESSYMITIPNGIGVLISLWKINKATDVSFIKKFPFIKIDDKDTYSENETKQYDKKAITFMSYIMYPIVGAYAIYSIIYHQHKGWYSFVLTILLDIVNVFGFITMTPQIYINYKLKSVEHLPWRALFYRFLNTIIDDLFVFVIKVPMHYRVFCFKDDIIFLIYVYQRWKYRVDKTRTAYGDAADPNKVIAPTTTNEAMKEEVKEKQEENKGFKEKQEANGKEKVPKKTMKEKKME